MLDFGTCTLVHILWHQFATTQNTLAVGGFYNR